MKHPYSYMQYERSLPRTLDSSIIIMWFTYENYNKIPEKYFVYIYSMCRTQPFHLHVVPEEGTLVMGHVSRVIT